MNTRTKYRKRATHPIVAVQLALDTAGFTYQKWGGQQRCKAGDWIVNNDGDVYTVDGDSFARTYRQTSTGMFVKSAPVWAEVARTSGRVPTKEGSTEYHPGDYLVFNEPDEGDPYAVSAAKFEAMYELADEPKS